MSITFEVPGQTSGKSRPKFFTGALKSVIENALKSIRERAAVIAETTKDAGAIAGLIRALSLHAAGSKFDGNPASYVHVYTPSETKDMETYVRTFGMAAMQGRAPMEGPIWLSIHALHRQPASWSKRKKADTFFVTGKPDLDNVLKLIGDALNEVCWKDDSQIAAIMFARTYAPDQAESVTISFGELVGRDLGFGKPNFLPQEAPFFPGMQL